MRTATRPRPTDRRGAVIVLSALLMIVVFAMAALAIDTGFMFVVRTELQSAADSGALAAANSLHLPPDEVERVGTTYVTHHNAGGRPIRPDEAIVEIGVWDEEANTFAPVGAGSSGNAVRVTARRQGESLFFARLIGNRDFTTEASAVAMVNSKDVVFVVDLSGSMNDDTEPAWATKTVNREFKSAGFGTIGNQLMQDVYDDFGFGVFPGDLEYIAAPLGVPSNRDAYAEMTSDLSPLAAPSVPGKYRIAPGDNEARRKRQAYNWMIENQIARLLPNAQPAPTIANRRYWEKYLDYIIDPERIRAPKPPRPPKPPKPPKPPTTAPPSPPTTTPPSTPPAPPEPPTIKPPPPPPIGWKPPARDAWQRLDTALGVAALVTMHRPEFAFGRRAALAGATYGAGASGSRGLPRVGGLNGGYSMNLPPNQDGDRIDKFNNPNNATFPKAKRSLPRAFRNLIGPRTYTQFLMDHGRDLRPDNSQRVELSIESGVCPMHNESVAGRTFSFPPRSQPMHAVRRSLISGLDVIEQRNGAIPDGGGRDRVGLVTFDTARGSAIRESLTPDYLRVMQSATTLQAAGDKRRTTATETGLRLAHDMLRRESEGGQARENATRIVVLLTDGNPNAYESADGAIDGELLASPDADYYGGGYYWLDAALLRSAQLHADKVNVFPVGIGLGTDYDFMDRVARLGGTADAAGQSPRGSGNPADYEQRLTAILDEIIKKPVARLVE